MLIVGLTGGLGTGKSSVASCFEECGATVLSADTIAHELIQPEGSCFEEVVAAFGTDILESGCISRQRLARLVFSQESELKKLEAILHPVVHQIMKTRMNQYKKEGKAHVMVLEIPLLFEVGWAQDVDVIIVVKATLEQQVNRSVEKLAITRQEALLRIKAQQPLDQKIKNADIVIDNSETLNKTREQVRIVWKEFQQDLKK